MCIKLDMIIKQTFCQMSIFADFIEQKDQDKRKNIAF